jgi:large subunit ribosomal protein L21
MYAIVEIAGKQFRVAKEQNVKVPRLEGDSGSKVNFDKVLFYSDDSGKSQIGKPGISNMAVSATIIEHGKDKKIIVFKKKRRKGYQKKNGHRQHFSIIKINDIGIIRGTAKPVAKVETKAKTESKKKAAPKIAQKTAKTKTKPAAKPKTTLAKKPATVKKTSAQKTVVKKPAEKKVATKSKPAAKPKKTSTKKKEA